MLKKKQRLSRSEFSHTMKKGKRVQNEYMSLVYLKIPEVKCGLVVSKKTAKKATQRNLLRRRIYSILGNNLDTLENKHVIVFTKPNTTQLTFTELTKHLETLIESIK